MYGSIRGPSPAAVGRSARCAGARPEGGALWSPGCSAEAHATWQAEIEMARRHAAGFALAELSRGRSRFTDEPFSLRWIYTHTIEEYARHNGHADLIRERIDGFTGE